MPEVELPDTEELEEMKGKRFTRRVAFTTAIFAVMLAITSLGGNNATKEMLLAQQQSSDQWAFYQSKVMREQLYKTQRLQMEAALLEREKAMRPDAVKHYESVIRTLTAAETRYETEKKAIEEEAKKMEAERDRNRKKDPYFDYAEVLLQIAIVMGSISILSNSRPVFYLAITSAILGSMLCLNGYLLIVNVPILG